MSSSSDPRLGSAASSSFFDPGRPGPLDTDVAVGLLRRAQALAEQGDWDLAAGTFARVVGHQDPALHTAALLGLAECRYRLDEDAAALQAWITATQAPENELSWRAWKALAIARVRESDDVGAARAYREAARRAPPEWRVAARPASLRRPAAAPTWTARTRCRCASGSRCSGRRRRRAAPR